MNAIEMIQRCACHGSPRGLGVSWHEVMRGHDEHECQQVSGKSEHRATQAPNLLVWNGRSHLLAIELKEDNYVPPRGLRASGLAPRKRA